MDDLSYEAIGKAMEVHQQLCPGLDELFYHANNGQCAIKVTALQDLQRAADRAILQTCLRLLNLPWGLVVNFGKQQIETQFAKAPRTS